MIHIIDKKSIVMSDEMQKYNWGWEYFLGKLSISQKLTNKE